MANCIPKIIESIKPSGTASVMTTPCPTQLKVVDANQTSSMVIGDPTPSFHYLVSLQGFSYKLLADNVSLDGNKLVIAVESGSAADTGLSPIQRAGLIALLKHYMTKCNLTAANVVGPAIVTQAACSPDVLAEIAADAFACTADPALPCTQFSALTPSPTPPLPTTPFVAANCTTYTLAQIGAAIVPPPPPTTLVSAGNTITVTVDGQTASAPIVNSAAISFNASGQIISTVNGVASASVGLPLVDCAAAPIPVVSGSYQVVSCANLAALQAQVNAIAAAEKFVVSGVITNPDGTPPIILQLTLNDGSTIDIDVTALEDIMSATQIMDALGTLGAGAVEVIGTTPTATYFLGLDNQLHQLQIPATVTALASAGNTITSTVDGVAATAPIINSNTLALSGTTLTSTINGVDASQDLIGLATAPAFAIALTSTVSGSPALSESIFCAGLAALTPTAAPLTNATTFVIGGCETTTLADAGQFLAADPTFAATLANTIAADTALSSSIVCSALGALPAAADPLTLTTELVLSDCTTTTLGDLGTLLVPPDVFLLNDGGAYDAGTNVLTLHLNNGTNVDIPMTGLVQDILTTINTCGGVPFDPAVDELVKCPAPPTDATACDPDPAKFALAPDGTWKTIQGSYIEPAFTPTYTPTGVDEIITATGDMTINPPACGVARVQIKNWKSGIIRVTGHIDGVAGQVVTVQPSNVWGTAKGEALVLVWSKALSTYIAAS